MAPRMVTGHPQRRLTNGSPAGVLVAACCYTGTSPLRGFELGGGVLRPTYVHPPDIGVRHVGSIGSTSAVDACLTIRLVQLLTRGCQGVTLHPCQPEDVEAL